MRLAIIPARGGSKRIPRKNIRLFCGKPMIAWTIEAAISSECFDLIVVSTDDAEVAEVSRRLGAEVPFMRPAALSDDHATTMAVVAHAVEWQSGTGDEPTEVCCLYATAPMLQAGDIRRGLDLLQTHDCSYVFSVTSYPFPIQRAVRLTSEGRVEMFDPRQFLVRSQDLEDAYHDAGQFYWGRAEAWIEQRPIFSSDAIPVILPRFRVQDIDTEEDWDRAEWQFQAMKR